MYLVVVKIDYCLEKNSLNPHRIESYAVFRIVMVLCTNILLFVVNKTWYLIFRRILLPLCDYQSVAIQNSNRRNGIWIIKYAVKTELIPTK